VLQYYFFSYALLKSSDDRITSCALPRVPTFQRPNIATYQPLNHGAKMRLFLLPISTRRTLLYCQKLQSLPSEKQPWVDKITLRAAKLWTGWEKKDSGWQKSVVTYGNRALRRIPYEEWGLKSVPTLSTRRREEEIMGREKHDLIFPESIIPATRAPQILQTLATEREGLHRSRMIWCFVGMPISAPFALVPV
jgi:hypothetical protein